MPKVSGAELFGADENLIAKEGASQFARWERFVDGLVFDNVGVQYALDVEGQSDGCTEENYFAHNGWNDC